MYMYVYIYGYMLPNLSPTCTIYVALTYTKMYSVHNNNVASVIFTWGTKASISLSLCALYVLSMQAAIQTLQCVCTRLKESGTALAWPPLSRSSLLVSKMNLCYMYMHVHVCAPYSEQLIFLRKSDCLVCAVLP